MKIRKLIALMLSVCVMAAFAVVPSFAATDVSSWLEKNIAIGTGDAKAPINDATTKTKTLKKSYQTYEYTQNLNPKAGRGTFSITKGILTENGKKTNVYLVSSHGLEGTAINQNDDMMSCIQAATEQNNAYLASLKTLVKAHVPKNSNIILVGHSLGGMVSQQFAADKAMQKRYNILHTVTYGSPLICKGQLEGQLHRLCSSGDVVPLLSVYTVTDLDAQLNERSREEVDGIIFMTHVPGYRDKDAWADYDAIGVKGGNATLKMMNRTTEVFNSPKQGSDYTDTAYAAVYIDGNWYGVSVLY